jgi:hypothetical protein
MDGSGLDPGLRRCDPGLEAGSLSKNVAQFFGGTLITRHEDNIGCIETCRQARKKQRQGIDAAFRRRNKDHA